MSAVSERLADAYWRLETTPVRERTGRVTEIERTCVMARMAGVGRGDLCLIARPDAAPLPAEVIALREETAVLAPFGTTTGLEPGFRVRRMAEPLSIPVSMDLMGRVIDPFGQPIDGLADISVEQVKVPVRSAPPDPMERPVIDMILATGLNAIDGPLTLGRGQRIGLFGPPGTGKSRLLADIASHAKADVTVIAMVGERGREVREFVETDLPPEKRRNTVIVTATSDRPSTERAICAQSATAIAEWFRDRGLEVLLLVDSLTRTARALREIGLAAGEPPTRRGYPASVYPALPALIERAGRTAAGSITAIYTVLVENDGDGDPIAEEVRSLTDGHIVLSGDLAEAGQFPAIDVLRSLSRCMPRVVTDTHAGAARDMRRLLVKYREIEILLQVGEYNAGSDPEADRAIAAKPRIEAFLRTQAKTGIDPAALADAMRQASA